MWADPKQPEAPVEYVVVWDGAIAAKDVKAQQVPAVALRERVIETPRNGQGETRSMLMRTLRSYPGRVWTYRRLAKASGLTERGARCCCIRLKQMGIVEVKRIKRMSERSPFTEIRYVGQ